MKYRFSLLLLSFCLLASFTARAQLNELQRSTPEAEGVPSQAIIALFDSITALPQTDIHSVMVLRHGKVIGEIYPASFAPEYRHTMYSCFKTIVGAAVGLAIADNRLRLTDRVGAFFPEQLPDSVSANLADMTVRNLLTMTSGITTDWNMRSLCSDWIRTYLAKPVKTPGKQFEYDSMSTYLLSAIVQKVTGMTVLDYLKLKLFTPMNITEVAWEISPEGVNTGGWGLHIQSESLAKFGQLLLNRGVWEGTIAQKYAGKRIALGENKYGWQSLSLQFKQKEVIMTVTDKEGAAYNLPFGYKQWLKTSIAAYPPYSISPIGSFKGIEGPFWVAGSYAWSSPATLQQKAHYVNLDKRLGHFFPL